jgi:hypothetical protein
MHVHPEKWTFDWFYKKESSMDSKTNRFYREHMTPKTPTLREAAQAVVDADTALRRYIVCGGDLNAGERMTKALEALRTALAVPAQGDDALDVRRYRWLRDHSEPGICAFYLSVGKAFDGVRFTQKTVDEAIDAQIAALASQENG